MPDEWKNEAAAERAKAGLPAINIELAATTFENHWAGEAGQKGVKRNWRATFRNWVLRERAAQIVPFPRPAGMGKSPAGRPGVMRTAVEVAEELNQRDAARAGGAQ